MGENLKAKLGVFVQHMQAVWRFLAMLADKGGILQKLLKAGAHLLAAFRAGVARQDGATIRYELIELISHRFHSQKLDRLRLISLIRAAGASSLWPGLYMSCPAVTLGGMFGLPRTYERPRNVRLDTLIRLRWLAVFGQFGTVLAVHFGLEFAVPIWPCFAVIALAALLNVALRLSFHQTQWL